MRSAADECLVDRVQYGLWIILKIGDQVATRKSAPWTCRGPGGEM
jgi:hypothetical protein